MGFKTVAKQGRETCSTSAKSHNTITGDLIESVENLFHQI